MCDFWGRDVPKSCADQTKNRLSRVHKRHEMKKKIPQPPTADDQVGCIGEFDSTDDICIKYCALNLRCAIEHYQNERLEVMEDIVASNSTFIKIQ
jgi:hypothetical protein